MILCHKCSGTIEMVEGLNSCQCINGYRRGFEEEVTFEQAATIQAKREIEWFAIYVSQRRESEFNPERLIRAIRSSTAFGHGTVDWEALAK